MDRMSRQKVHKDIEDLDNTVIQLDLIDIYRTFHSKTAEYTVFFKCTWIIYQGSPYCGT